MEADLLKRALILVADNFSSDDATILVELHKLGLDRATAVRLLWFAPYAFAKDAIEAIGFSCDEMVTIATSHNQHAPPDEAEEFHALLVLQPEYLHCLVLIRTWDEATGDDELKAAFRKIALASVWVKSASDYLDRHTEVDGVTLHAVLHSDDLSQHVIH